MFLRIRSAALHVALVASVVMSPGVASAETIFGCLNKTNGGVRIVAEGVPCLNSELPVSWSTEGIQGPAGPAGPTGPTGPTGPAGPAGAGVKTVAAIVNADGSPNAITSNGFSANRLGTGIYQVNFPAGTWTSFPVMTVTSFGVSGAYGNPVVTSVLGFGDGSAQFQIHMVRTNTAELFDNAFMFTAVASQAAP